MGPEVNPGVPLPTLKHKGSRRENANRGRVAPDPGRVRERMADGSNGEKARICADPGVACGADVVSVKRVTTAKGSRVNIPNPDDVRRAPAQTSAVRRIRRPRRRTLTAGALSLTAVGALIVSLFVGTPAALADDYPSWDDVQAAKASESATADQVNRIQGLIASLTQNVADTKAAAEVAGNEYFKAQQDANIQAERTRTLEGQAAEKKKLADESASKAGQVLSLIHI